MKLPTLKKIIYRLYNFYVKKHLFKLFIALLLSFAVAGGTAAIAWLLDPAVKKIFIEQDKSMALLIPIAIIKLTHAKNIYIIYSNLAYISI